MKITYHQLSLDSEDDFESCRQLIGEDLSEPYSIYVYRFFLNQWPSLCFLARDESTSESIGVIISKLEPHRGVRMRGYIGMLAVKEAYRGRGIAKQLVKKGIDMMIKMGADEIMLETEVVNKPALGLYENMGFLRVKRLYRYYLNKHDAYRLILPVTKVSSVRLAFLPQLEGESLESVV